MDVTEGVKQGYSFLTGNTLGGRAVAAVVLLSVGWGGHTIYDAQIEGIETRTVDKVNKLLAPISDQIANVNSQLEKTNADLRSQLDQADKDRFNLAEQVEQGTKDTEVLQKALQRQGEELEIVKGKLAALVEKSEDQKVTAIQSSRSQSATAYGADYSSGKMSPNPYYTIKPGSKAGWGRAGTMPKRTQTSASDGEDSF